MGKINCNVKEMVASERPREKAIRYGIASLSNRDLLAIILRCGYRGNSVLLLADQILNETDGLIRLSKLNLNDLVRFKGISVGKALTLLACFELVKRVEREQLSEGSVIDNPQALFNYVNKKIGFKQREELLVLFLDTRNRVIKDDVVFKGTLNQSIAHPREIFKQAIAYSTAGIIIAHNHPSGDPLPSECDLNLTNQIKECGSLTGIPLVDHIIVSNNNYFSFKKHGLI